MILRKMIADPPDSGIFVHILKYWGGLLIWTGGLILLCAIDYLVLILKTSIYHIKHGTLEYYGLGDMIFSFLFLILLLLSLYQLFLFKWKKTFVSVYWRCFFIIIQLVIGYAVFVFISLEYVVYIACYDSI